MKILKFKEIDKGNTVRIIEKFIALVRMCISSNDDVPTDLD